MNPEHNSTFQELRAGLDTLEAANADAATIGSELFKIGAALSMAALGPRSTMEAMTALLAQIANEFPSEFAAASANLKFPPVQGNG